VKYLTAPTCQLRQQAVGSVCGPLRRRLQHRDDSGQALVIVVVLLALLVLLVPFMVRQVTVDAPLFNSSTNKHAALAAAEAGIQWYRDNLDSHSAYYNYTAANNPDNDPALSGYCGAGLPSTCDLAGTNPAEAFHYVPVSDLTSTGGFEAGSVVLTVTGRAGVPGTYTYVYAQATFSPQSVLDDAYYSNYEVLDPNSLTIQGIDVSLETPPGTLPATSNPETQSFISYTYTTGSTSTTTPSESVWQAVCQYDTYSENTFVDTLGLTINGTKYSPSYPYYGPYQENSSFNFEINSGGAVVTSGGATEITVPAMPCEYPYDFVSGETFTGPVYTNDQLHVCGSPAFDGSPVSLTSGAPSDVPYLPVSPTPRNLPGSVKVTAANSGTNGPYPSSLIGDYVPAGYTVDTVNCNGTGDTPTLSHGVALNGNQSLPSLNTALAEYGTTNPPGGAAAVGTGCTYTGPTMIELVTSGTTTTMDVWSPLSSASSTTSVCSNGSTFSASNPFISGIPLPSDGVVYVQNYTSSVTPTVPSDGSSPCFNPYQYAQQADSSQCLEGDVYIEGELHGQLTVASAANIMITRDLTYQCADGSGGASATDPSSVTGGGCTTEAAPDILGLSAKYDVVVSHNDPSLASASTQDCINKGFGDGTGSPVNQKSGSFAGTVLDGTYYANDPAAVWPTVCDPTNIIVDAAVLALNGSFGTENWDDSPYSQFVNLNGTDLSEYRGPFGIEGQDGYEKDFNYDTRLAYISPPYAIPGAVPIWQVDDYIVCSSSSCPAIS